MWFCHARIKKGREAEVGIVVVSGLASGVGKTTATAAIVKILQAKGRDVVPAKIARLQNLCASPDIGTIEKLTGIRGEDFSQLDDPLVQVCHLSESGKTVVVEGSGGLSVALIGKKTIADIAAELDAPLVVVSGMNRGAVELAVNAVGFARACGANVAGLLGGKLPAGADLRTRLTLVEASRASGVPFIGSLNDGVGSLGCEPFAEALSTIFIPDEW
ncbi:dithiobiotin synthetase [Corynebacterium diphtheriae HC01]|uniref:Dethiobiotin synthetase n=2 Tax=Corynebacterium diphtheriae TaxID=1717 RepID=A0A854NIM8_CORDP|nr:dethiobiotin synthase [Corynebacterium diphtheriae]AEX44185.1 dithiobiotin synthetase [Corynebacterium diphtheriae 241]AEX46402.1 dithiobiotin synthetase [Corynebacterium diphtheriae INCA 402]AEX48694.1 dithiobiotin synthetase [Corynebacterium diphtheriae BH8]AEX67381.1 dithiobiotin synthetase [Corynebacterium diphtheriae C7 (beta)]AEX72083.1 dithiobiotin synthetase [Corynebacterium diphtheriae CDCE 8392]